MGQSALIIRKDIMSDHTNGEVQVEAEAEAESAPGGSPLSGNGSLSSKHKASPITPTPLKKSKRQAERSAKGAFAASLRKEEEESKFYQSKKQKAKKLPNLGADNSSTKNNDNDAQGKPKQAQSNTEKEGEEALQVVTPSPTQSSAAISKPSETSGQSSTTAKTKPSEHELGLSVETTSNGEHLKRPRDKNPTANRKRRKLVYKAVSGSTQTIYKYALDLLSHVCNNAYTLPPPKKITPKNDDPSTFAISKGPQEAHRILDRPISGYTLESEPEKERCMRLQLRQRFASATAIGMSPIEFATKLLKLWGGKLEQVYETARFTNIPTNHNNNPSSSLKKKSRMKKAALRNDGSNGATTPYPMDNALHPDDQFNGYDSDPYNPNRIFHENVIPTDFKSDIFGDSKVRMERANKLLKRKHRKDLKKAEKKAPRASMPVNPEAPTNVGSSKETIGKEKNPGPKRKPGRRTPRKLMDDPSIPVLLKGLRLAHPEDPEHVNTLHCFVRSKLLEVYVLKGETIASIKDNKDDETSQEEPPNLVGIRCAFCGPLPKSQRGTGQTMAVFFPKSIGEIYRGVCTWQRIHFPVCQHMPEDYRREYKTRKEMDPTRGKKVHWIKSAYDLGLRNIDSMRSGLTYRPDAPYDIEEVLKIDIDPGGGQYTSKTKRATNKKSPRNEPQEHAVAPLSPGGHDEFELFGTDFDRSLEDEV